MNMNVRFFKNSNIGFSWESSPESDDWSDDSPLEPDDWSDDSPVELDDWSSPWPENWNKQNFLFSF